MVVQLSVPNELAEALRAEGRAVEKQIAVDLAISYYERGHISVGKAAEVSGLKRGEFEQELARRKVVRPFSSEDLAKDLGWARDAAAEA